MILWKDQNCIRCLCHRLGACSDASHHRAAYKINGILHGHISRLRNNLIQCASDGNPYCYRIFHFRHNRYILICHRFLFFHSTVYIVDRLYVKYDDALLDGQSAGAYHTSGSFIDQNYLVSHRIHFIQKMDPHSGEFFNMLLQCFYSLHIRFFDADDSL